MSMDWFRWHHGTVTDPKWRVIARKSGASVRDVLAVFAFFLERASQAEPRGCISGWDADDVGAGLDMDSAQVMAVYDAMQGKVLDGDTLSGWEKRQPKREREETSTDRVRKYRESKKSANSNDGVTDCETPCNANETHVTPGNANETHETPRLDEMRGEEIEKEDIGGADAQPDLAFLGRVIRLTRKDYTAWRATYRNIANLDAELTAADAYYADNPPKGGKWFFPVANWLKRADEQSKPKPRFGL